MKHTKVCICLLAFLVCSSCKSISRQERKLLRSFLFLTETEKQKSSCHKSWWRASVSLAVCSTVSFQCCISLPETTCCFVRSGSCLLLRERAVTRQLLKTRLAGSFQMGGGTCGWKTHGSALGPPLLWRL